MLALVFLGCVRGVAFSLRLPILRLDRRLRLLALWVFATDLITGCLCICVSVLSGAAELSSFSPPARRGVGYC